MYNKLILENEEKEFTIKFDGVEHVVPNGKFEAEETLGNFILGQARKWGIKVAKLSQPEKPRVTKIEPVINEINDEAETVKEEETKTKKDEDSFKRFKL